MNKATCISVVCLLFPSAVMASLFPNWGSSARVGYTYPVIDKIGMGTEYKGLKFSHSSDNQRVNNKEKLKLDALGAYVDFFPFHNSFRVSVGALMGRSKIHVAAKVIGDTIVLRDEVVSEDPRSQNIELAEYAPYFGVGYGQPFKRSPFNYKVDFGIAVGRVKTYAKEPEKRDRSLLKNNISSKQQVLQQKNDFSKMYPIVTLTLLYTF